MGQEWSRREGGRDRGWDATDGPSSSRPLFSCSLRVPLFAGVAGAKADDGGVSQETFNSFLLAQNGTFGIQ